MEIPVAMNQEQYVEIFSQNLLASTQDIFRQTQPRCRISQSTTCTTGPQHLCVLGVGWGWLMKKTQFGSPVDARTPQAMCPAALEWNCSSYPASPLSPNAPAHPSVTPYVWLSYQILFFLFHMTKLRSTIQQTLCFSLLDKPLILWK